ncbi:MAG: hypothetical protein IKE65_03805 [Clostridia bacterium]|nr:hypothetical protein [Clostridia bacterium]
MRLTFKPKKWIALALALLLSIQCVPGIHAFAAAIDKNSSFEFKLSKSESAPGNIQVDLYMQTDPDELITTAGATLVINTDYVDVVNKKGAAITDDYKKDVVVLGKNFPVTAGKIGEEQESFSSIKGMSLASYNEKSKNLYIFVCGMAVSGIQVPQKSLFASYYLQAKKDGALPEGAIRLAKASEIGKDCPSKAVYVTQISSKKEVGTAPSAITLSADEALIEGGGQTVEPETTPAQQEDTTKKQEDTAKGDAPADTDKQSTTKAISDMTEQEVEEELVQKIQTAKSLNLSDAQKESAAYKAYEKAIEEAEKILSDENATAEQKQEALERVREAQLALETEFPELIDQLEPEQASSSKKVWIFAGIGAAVAVAAAVIIVIVIKKKKQKLES